MKNLSLKIMLVLAVVLAASSAYAELKLNSVYPNVGEMGKDLTVTLTGKGFNQNTRVSMYPDTTNKKNIIGSKDTPDIATNLTVIDHIAYLLVRSIGLLIVDVSDLMNPTIIAAMHTHGLPCDIKIINNIAYIADGESGLQIIDVTNPKKPNLIGSVDTPDFAESVIIVDQIAYIADNDSGLQVIDISNVQKPTIIGYVDTPGIATGVTVRANIAYVADGDNGLQVIDISNPKRPTLIGSIDTEGYAYDVFVIDNIAYLADGESGLKVIDISIPSRPIIIGYKDTAGEAWRLTLVKNTVFISDAEGGIQVMDISNPRKPILICTLDTSDFVHNTVVIDNIAYIANGMDGLLMMNIQNLSPMNIIGNLNTDDFAFRIKNIGNTVYIADGFSGIKIVDISSPNKPTLISSIDTPNHAYDLSVVNDIAYVADGESGLQVIDVNDPLSPKQIGSLKTRDIAVGITVIDNLAYVADSSGGLQIIDVSNPTPIIIGAINIPDDKTYDVAVVGNLAYVAAGYSGLKVIDISNPKNPNIIGSRDTSGCAIGISVEDNIVYIADEDDGLQIIDVSIPEKPTIIRTVDTPDAAFDVSVVNHIAYIADLKSGLQVIDVRNPNKPVTIGSIPTLDRALSVAIKGDKAFIADGYSGLSIVSLPVEIKSVIVKDPESITLTLPNPKIHGNYTLRVFNDTENFELLGAVTFMASENYQTLQKRKAIIIGGSSGADNLSQQTLTCSNYAYISLRSQGYSHENIYYLISTQNIDIDGDGYNDINGDATYENLYYAFNIWARDASELIFFMVDHGGDKFFYINGTDSISADKLDSWLDNLQMTMPGRLTVVYDACRSGSFLSMTPPVGKERIIIASSSADQRAWLLNNGVLSFSYQFWASVFLNANLKNAFVDARDIMQKNQSALVDANGNGIANEKEDLTLLNDIIIGRGRIAASPLPPFIGTVSGEQTLDGRRDASFEAKNISSLNKVKRVWAVIVPPDYNLASANQPVTELPVVEMTDNDNDGVYQGYYDNFTQTGIYKFNIYAADDQDSYSVPQQTAVIQTKGNSCISVSSNLAFNICADYHGAKYGFTLKLDDAAQLSWKADLGTFRELQSDSGNCISVRDDLKLNMCAEYQGKTFGFTLNYDKDAIWKVDIGTFREIH